MDLVSIGRYISSLEEENIKYIKKLNFLKFNVWKIYRNYYVTIKYAQLQTKNKSIQFINKDIINTYKKAKLIANNTIIRITSATYNTQKENVYYSSRIDILKKSMSRISNVSIIGQSSVEKLNKVEPKIDLLLDSNVNFIAKKLRYLALIITFVIAFLHYQKLKKIDKITFKKTWSLLSEFYIKYIIYLFYYKIIKPKSVLFTFASYGCEAEIAALKKLDIKILEYQHGHFYSEHYGYNYNKLLKPLKQKLLLPDNILVFSDYWIRILTGLGFFDDYDFRVTGNPSFESIEKLILNTENKTPVLVCSQPNSSYLFMEFINNYNANSDYKDQFFWIIKLHPREESFVWNEFIKNHNNVEITSENTYSLLKSVDIQVTGSSTTLYEALYFGVSNYILLNDLKLNESASFDASIGKIIKSNFVEKLIYNNKEKNSTYFKDFTYDL